MGKKKISIRPTHKSYIEAIKVGPVWTKVVLRLRTDLLVFQGTRMKARRAKKKLA